jgi:hypothetical protein
MANTKSKTLASICLLLAVLDASALADPTESPRFELATDPLGLLQGRYALAATYALTDHFAVRGSIMHGDATTQLTVFRATVSVLAYLDRAFHGPFLEAGYAWEDQLLEYSESAGEPTETWTIDLGGPELLLGWQWTYAKHYSLSATVGAMRVWRPAVSELPAPTIEYESYVNVGYVF